MTFKETHLKKIDAICSIIGKGWKINHVESMDHQIVVFNPDYKKVSVFFQSKDSRFVISCHVENKYRTSDVVRITVAPTRTAAAIAGDIERRIIAEIGDLIAKRKEETEEYENKLAKQKLVKNLFLSFGEPFTYQGVCEIRMTNGIRATYRPCTLMNDVKVCNLSDDNLIKLAAFLKGL